MSFSRISVAAVLVSSLVLQACGPCGGQVAYNGRYPVVGATCLPGYGGHNAGYPVPAQPRSVVYVQQQPARVVYMPQPQPVYVAPRPVQYINQNPYYWPIWTPR